MGAASRRLPIVIWIVLWIVLATWMALGTLTSTQFHNDLQRHNAGVDGGADGAVPTILSLLERKLERFEALDDAIVELNRKAADVDASKAALEFDLGAKGMEIESLQTRLKELDERRSDLLKESSQGAVALGIGPELPTEDVDKERGEVAAKLVKCQAERDDIRNALQKYQSQGEALSIERMAAEKRFAKHLEDGRRLDLVQQIKTVSNLGFHFLFRLPRNLVVLLMSLAMGALGSAVFIAYYLIHMDDEKPQTGTWYFVRPFQGMVMGLIMYLAANTGLFVFSDSKEAGEGLNPYTISVLAIISGMMAEQAYRRIQRFGEDLLSKGGT